MRVQLPLPVLLSTRAISLTLAERWLRPSAMFCTTRDFNNILAIWAPEPSALADALNLYCNGITTRYIHICLSYSKCGKLCYIDLWVEKTFPGLLTHLVTQGKIGKKHNSAIYLFVCRSMNSDEYMKESNLILMSSGALTYLFSWSENTKLFDYFHNQFNNLLNFKLFSTPYHRPICSLQSSSLKLIQNHVIIPSRRGNRGL